ncbi:family 78 glycoside hydrolase catalytic domain [Paenarthrobacter sp. YAF11_1]|uniref:alpha-L-rhamnosidase n=1 Tax=Paenarthrobacter sp. YAF11_1 TaxID=3233074 RepID=UPI003F9677B4
MNSPTHVRLEHLNEGEPCGVPTPRLSWWLPEDAGSQTAYEIEVGGIASNTVEPGTWSSGRVENDRNVLVDALAGCPSPVAGERRTIQLKVWTEQGTSDWSREYPWLTGLLSPADLGAEWIEPFESVAEEPGRRPAYSLRQSFETRTSIASARLLVTAHGIYEAFLNGHRVGDLELTPGFTSYRSNLQVQQFDVTDMVTEGGNALGLLVSDGWFRGRHGFEREANGFGNRVAVLAELHLSYADGTTEVVGTDRSWRSTPSLVTAADLMDGQFQLGGSTADWAAPGFDASGWANALPASEPLTLDRTRLITSVAPPVKAKRTLEPVSVTGIGSGSWVVDFGENINGWVRLSNLGPKGTRSALLHGESLNQNGSVTTDHLRAFMFATQELLPAGQVDVVVAKGVEGEVFEPRHTTHGFRYVQIDGGPEELSSEDIRAVFVHSDLEERGTFTCSDEAVNWLHEAAVRSFLGNACDIPTDCPQRERSGFTGDWQIYVDAAAFTHDVAGFTDKWLRDLAADQWSDGTVPTVIPNPPGNVPSGNPFTDMSAGSAGWADAAVIVPWKIWRQYGDLELLRRQYPSMVKWVESAAQQAAGGRHHLRAAEHPEPRAHETYLWDTGFHFGEWLEPDEIPSMDPTKDHGIVATAYLAHSARLLADSAAALGCDADHDRFGQIADGAREAWALEYLNEDGHISVPSQANHVRALQFGLVPPAHVQTVADRLAELVTERDYRLSTGFLSTGMLLQALADNGHTATAYRVLMSDGIPSWMAMRNRGATTIWERWDGVNETGAANASLNHYSKGAVISFLHQYVAGIRPAPQTTEDTAGYRRFLVAPHIGGGLDFAKATHQSPYGLIGSEWTVTGNQVQLDITVPPGTQATLELRDSSEVLPPGQHRRTVPTTAVKGASALVPVS